MSRILQLAGLLIFTSGALLQAEQTRDAQAPLRPVLPKKGSGGRGNGPRLTNPGSPASRLYRASPPERERALEKLPLRQQERIRKNLEWFDGLAKPDQEIVLKRAERYEAMSPQARQAFNQQFRELVQLPPDRRQALGAALRRLQAMSDEQRAKVLSSPAFTSRFSPEEIKLITGLSQVIPPGL